MNDLQRRRALAATLMEEARSAAYNIMKGNFDGFMILASISPQGRAKTAPENGNCYYRMNLDQTHSDLMTFIEDAKDTINRVHAVGNPLEDLLRK